MFWTNHLYYNEERTDCICLFQHFFMHMRPNKKVSLSPITDRLLEKLHINKDILLLLKSTCDLPLELIRLNQHIQHSIHIKLTIPFGGNH